MTHARFTCTAVQLCSQANPAMPSLGIDAHISGTKRFEELVINLGMTVRIAIKVLQKVKKKVI